MSRRTSVAVSSAVCLALGVAGADAAEQVSLSQIQGAAHASPFAGRIVATQGVVTSVTGSGFYLQDPQGDGDFATPDAIFVGRKLPQGTGPGAVVEVAGRVIEDASRVGAPPTELPITKIDGAVVKVVGNGPVPPPLVIGQGGRQPPTEIIEDDGLTVFDPETDGLDFWESLEGMLVRANDLVVVGPSNGFHENWVVADNGAAASGMNTDGGITVAPGDFNPERIQLRYFSLRATPSMVAWLLCGAKMGRDWCDGRQRRPREEALFRAPTIPTMSSKWGQARLALSAHPTGRSSPASPCVTPGLPFSRCYPGASAECLNLVPQEGLEPPTHALRMRCSTN